MLYHVQIANERRDTCVYCERILLTVSATTFSHIEGQVATGKSPQLRNVDVQQDRRCCPKQASQITSILHVLQEEGGKPSPNPWANVVA